MLNKQHLRALGIVVAVLGCGLALIALAGQVVSAQSVEPQLKPPFKFAERPAAPGLITPGPGSTVLMTETFGASFAPVTGLTGSTPQWRIVRNADDTAGYFWDKVGGGTFSNSAWSAARKDTATQTLTPGVDTYPAGQDSWLIYGPIDLSKFIYAYLSFEYYLDSRTGSTPDTLSWGYSTDGQTFYGNSQSGPLGRWITDTLAININAAPKTVYLAFAFNSHSSPQGLGAFVRNVRLTGEPLKYAYMPRVLNNYTAPPDWGPYTFAVGDSTDINHWGGAGYFDNGTFKYGQCVPGQCAIHATLAHGNPASSLRLYTNGTYAVVATSPNDVVSDNYDLYVDISPVKYFPRWAGCSPSCPENDLGDWYGIIFNARNDTFGANPSEFHYNYPYYRLYFYNYDSLKPIYINLDRCDGSSKPSKNNCVTKAVVSVPANFIGGADGFDTVHIQRLAGGTIQVWVDNTLIISVWDPTYSGSFYGKYGVFMFSSSYNDTTNPPTGGEMQVDFDNIKVYKR